MTARRRATAALAGLIATFPLALVVGFGPTASAASAASAPSWLARINAIRAGSGLSKVGVDTAWNAGIKDHLRYVAKSPAKYQTGKYANAHTENPKSPYYTKAGAREAGRSDLAFYTTSDLNAINGWLEAPFHAIGILRPGLRKVAFVRDPKTGDAGLDVLGGDHDVAHSKPILYPGSGATINLSAYAGESPSPIETCTTEKPHANYSAPGLPLIVLLAEAPATGLSATLKHPDGKTVSSSGNDLCVVDEKTFTSSDPVYGTTGREILADDHAVLIIPRTRLVSGRYTVHISQPSTPTIAWSFKSKPAIPAPQVRIVAHCSTAHHHTGSATLYINPTASSRTVHYAVTLGTKTKHGTESGGFTTHVSFHSLAPGRHPAKIVGSDGSKKTATVRIPTCRT